MTSLHCLMHLWHWKRIRLTIKPVTKSSIFTIDECIWVIDQLFDGRIQYIMGVRLGDRYISCQLSYVEHVYLAVTDSHGYERNVDTYTESDQISQDLKHVENVSRILCLILNFTVVIVQIRSQVSGNGWLWLPSCPVPPSAGSATILSTDSIVKSHNLFMIQC
jgi:hypothetical protein